MIDFNEIYSNLSSVDNSVYAGLAVIATAALSVSAIFYLGKKYCFKDWEKDKEMDLKKKFEGKLIQYIGRVQRSGKPPVIFDYRDSKIDYFEKMFKQRNRYYNKLRK